MASARKKPVDPSEPPFPKVRFVKLKEAKALLAAGGWMLDTEKPPEIPGAAYVSDRGEIMFFCEQGKSPVYESRKAWYEWWTWAQKQPKKPEHLLDGLLPQGSRFIELIPTFLDELPAHLNLPRESLDFSYESLRLVDDALKNIRPRRRIIETPSLFAGLIAYLGEVARKEFGGQWELEPIPGDIWEPYVTFEDKSYFNPWLQMTKNVNERRRVMLEPVMAALQMSRRNPIKIYFGPPPS